MYSIGSGISKCAFFTENVRDPAYILLYEQWTDGFWTGLNEASDNHNVGKSAGADEIFEAVKRECQSYPTKYIKNAVGDVWVRFFKENR
jgi:hypothetical protein